MTTIYRGGRGGGAEGPAGPPGAGVDFTDVEDREVLMKAPGVDETDGSNIVLDASENVTFPAQAVVMGDRVDFNVGQNSFCLRRDTTSGNEGEFIMERDVRANPTDPAILRELFRISEVGAVVNAAHFRHTAQTIPVQTGEICISVDQIGAEGGGTPDLTLTAHDAQGNDTLLVSASVDGTARVITNLSATIANPSTVAAEYRTLGFADFIPRTSSSALTITSSNVSDYANEFVLFTNESGTVDLTIEDDVFTVGNTLQIKHYSAAASAASVRIVQQGSGADIDGESDITVDMDNGITMVYLGSNAWRVISNYISGAVSGTDNFVNGAVFSGDTLVLTREANGSLTATMPSATQTTDGSFSRQDKTKLDGIEAGSRNLFDDVVTSDVDILISSTSIESYRNRITIFNHTSGNRTWNANAGLFNENDIVIIKNNSSDPDATVTISQTSSTIDGQSSIVLGQEEAVLLHWVTTTAIEVTSDRINFGTHDATELNDITSAGSGAIITADERNKLNGIATGAEVNVQSDWNETDTGSDAFIQNKPTINGGGMGNPYMRINDVTANLVINSSNADTYRNGVIYGRGNVANLIIQVEAGAMTTGDTLVIKNDSPNSVGQVTLEVLGGSGNIDGFAVSVLEHQESATFQWTDGATNVVEHLSEYLVLGQHNATELGGIDSTGSGDIITDAERERLNESEANATPVLVEFAADIADPTYAQLRALFDTADAEERYEHNSSNQVEIDFTSSQASSQRLYIFWNRNVTIGTVALEVGGVYLPESWTFTLQDHVIDEEGTQYYVYKSDQAIGHGGGDFNLRIDYTPLAELSFQGETPQDNELILGTGNSSEVKGADFNLLNVNSQLCLPSGRICPNQRNVPNSEITNTSPGHHRLDLRTQAQWEEYRNQVLVIEDIGGENQTLWIELPILTEDWIQDGDFITATAPANDFVEFRTRFDTFEGLTVTNFRLFPGESGTIQSNGTRVWQRPAMTMGNSEGIFVDTLWGTNAQNQVETRNSVSIAGNRHFITDDVQNHTVSATHSGGIATYSISDVEALAYFLSDHGVLDIPFPTYDDETRDDDATTTYLSTFWGQDVTGGGTPYENQTFSRRSENTPNIIQAEFFTANQMRLTVDDNSLLASATINGGREVRVRGLTNIEDANYEVHSISHTNSTININLTGASASNNEGDGTSNIGTVTPVIFWRLQDGDANNAANFDFQIEYSLSPDNFDTANLYAIHADDVSTSETDSWLNVDYLSLNNTASRLTVAGNIKSTGGEIEDGDGNVLSETRDIADTNAAYIANQNTANVLSFTTSGANHDVNLATADLIVNQDFLYLIPDPATFLDPGEMRDFTIASAPTNTDDITIGVGTTGSRINFFGGYQNFHLRNGRFVIVTAYNVNGTAGVIIRTPIKRKVSGNDYTASAGEVFTNLDTLITGWRRLSINADDLVAGQDEDPLRYIFDFTTNANMLTVQYDGRLFINSVTHFVNAGDASTNSDDFCHAQFGLFHNGSIVGKNKLAQIDLKRASTGGLSWQLAEINEVLQVSAGDTIQFGGRLTQLPQGGVEESDINVRNYGWTFTLEENIDN